MKEWAAWIFSRFRVTVGLLQEIHAVLGGSKATFESDLTNFESVEALESNGDALNGLIPDVDSALPLLLIVVFGLAVDEDPGYLSILPEKFLFPHSTLLAVLLGKPDDIEEIRDDHSELLETHQVVFLSVTQLILVLVGELMLATWTGQEAARLTAFLLLLTEAGMALIANLHF